MAASRSEILIVGATGLVGAAVVARARQRPISLLARRALDGLGPTVKVHVAHSNQWNRRIASIRPDTLVCCVGTTMRAAGGEVPFRAVDEYLVLACADAARRAGTRHMIVVTSVGASTRVGNVYLNAKGKVEEGLTALGFDRLDILRPGLLTGPRTERRPMEALFQFAAPLLDPLLIGGLRRYRSIPAPTLAHAIWTLIDRKDPGRFVHEHDDQMALAG